MESFTNDAPPLMGVEQYRRTEIIDAAGPYLDGVRVNGTVHEGPVYVVIGDIFTPGPAPLSVVPQAEFEERYVGAHQPVPSRDTRMRDALIAHYRR